VVVVAARYQLEIFRLTMVMHMVAVAAVVATGVVMSAPLEAVGL
jgi:hypothetical protein